MNLMNFILLWANDPNEAALGSITAGQLGTYIIVIALVLLAITAFLAVVGPLVYSVLNIGDSWQGLAAGAGLVVLAFIAYSISSGEVLADYAMEKEGLTLQTSRLIETVLYLFFILFIPAVALLLFSIVRDVALGFFK